MEHNILAEIESAAQRIQPLVHRTPLIRSAFLSDLVQGEVYLKLESEQATGSFKARGSANKVAWLKEQDYQGKVITASTGNHGMGVARALGKLGMDGKVVIPESTVKTKQQALKSLGAEVEIHGPDCFVSETYADQQAKANKWIYISPYNDPQIIGGQGTIGKEILEQLPDTQIDQVFVTIGGGGLISGIATWIKAHSPNTKIIGCQPSWSPEMTLSVKTGSYVTIDQKETLSDASAGAFEPDSITFDICRNLIDDYHLIEEEAIAQSIVETLDNDRKLIEGAAAVAVASLRQNIDLYRGKTSVIVICGGNISRGKLKKVLNTKA